MIRKFYSPLILLICSVNVLLADIVYVANSTGNSITAFDSLTNQVTTITDPTFNSLNTPFIPAVTPDGKLCFVSNGGISATYVTVIDTETNSVIAAINVGSASNGIAISPDGQIALVVLGGSVQIIDIPSLMSTTSVYDPDVTFLASELAVFTPDGKKAYVSNAASGSGYGSVSVIDMTMSPPTVVFDITDSSFVIPGGLNVTPDGTKLYVANYFSDELTVVNASNDQVLTTVTVGTSPTAVVFSSDGKTGFSSNLESNTISVFDTETNLVTRTIPLGADWYPKSIAISYNSTLYVDNSTANAIGFLPSSANAVTGSFPTGIFPGGIAIKSIYFSPTDVSKCQEKNVFLTQTDYVNILTWSAPTAAQAVSYNIYRDAALTDLAGSVSANGPLEFFDHNRVKGQVYTYYVVSVSENGTFSLPAQMTVSQKCSRN